MRGLLAKLVNGDITRREFAERILGAGGRTHRLNNISHKRGGNMIDHPDEDPMIRAMFEEELKKNGVEARMPSVSKGERQ
jgi:hypothetical protein